MVKGYVESLTKYKGMIIVLLVAVTLFLKLFGMVVGYTLDSLLRRRKEQ